MASTSATIHMHTLATIFAQIQGHQAGYPWVPLGNFIMDFFRNYPEHQQELIADPIQEHPQVPESKVSDEAKEAHQWAVFCAASAEYLAHRYSLDCPAWVHDPAYTFLPESWYFAPMAYKKASVKERAERTTPEEFARRNIYCGDKVYVDKYAEAQRFVTLRQTA